MAFVDYDNDGWMDIFLVNSGPVRLLSALEKPRNGLYRNNRNGTFTDVTGAAGVAGGDSFGMGVAVGDYDNDGYPDLFVTAYGRCTLYRNNRNGTFTDVTAKAGVATPGWTTSAALVRLRWRRPARPVRLQLRPVHAREPGALHGGPRRQARLLRPANVPADRIASSTRTTATARSATSARRRGIAARLGKALGVVATDINNDGRMDLFVANDTVENFLFANRGAQGWEDIAFGAMVALSPDGWPRSGMGVDSADIDGDGWQDLFVSNIDKEMFPLYRNTGHRHVRRSVVRRARSAGRPTI